MGVLRRAGLDVVGFEYVALVTVGGETLAAFLFTGFVGAYKLGHARERVSEARYLITEVDQQIAWFYLA